MNNEPKAFECDDCKAQFKKPRLYRAVLSTFETLKAHGCPKCCSTKIKRRQEWLDWHKANNDTAQTEAREKL